MGLFCFIVTRFKSSGKKLFSRKLSALLSQLAALKITILPLFSSPAILASPAVPSPSPFSELSFMRPRNGDIIIE